MKKVICPDLNEKYQNVTKEEQDSKKENEIPIECSECSIKGKLMCHFDKKDSVNFAVPLFIIWISMIVGNITALIQGNLSIPQIIWSLGGYIAYMFLFLQVWENKILCSHCPYYAFNEDKILKCYANYGLKKLWKYDPNPMSKSEQIQFLIGLAIFIGYPIIFLVLGKQYLYLSIYLIGSVIWIVSMHFLSCKKCPNFGCPLNNVPKDVKEEYLKRNKVMGEAWAHKFE